MARILVVDDEEQVRLLLRQVLERSGYQVIEASNGKVALDLIREEAVDLIITDLVMPEKEGMEMIIELKKEFPEIKVIAISGGGRVAPEEYLRISRVLGAMRTFAKPIDRKELLTAVEGVLGYSQNSIQAQ